MSLNTDLLLREHNGDLVANVYQKQVSLNESFDGDYHTAYAYGNEDAPRVVHERVAAIGAKDLGLDVDVYLELWDEAVHALLEYNDLPEEFKDNRYIA